MLRYRYLIPLFLGILCLGLALAGALNRSTTVLADGQKTLDANGVGMEFHDVELRADRHYRLAFGPLRGVPLNATAVVGASLAGEKGVVFELDDAYWHERGTWYEEGESGTWEEANATTVFDFRVPEAGKYDFDITVEQTSMGPIMVGAQVLESDPLPYAEWPFLLGGILLIVMAGWVAYKRGDVMMKWVATLGTGSKIKISGEDWDVSRWAEYDDGESVSIELTLTSPAGKTIYVLAARLERCWEDSEGDDHTKYYHQVLLGIPVEEDEVTMSGRIASCRKMHFDMDDDNTGTERYREYRELAVATTSYFSTMYRPTTFPTRPGEMWLERSRDINSGEVEWTLHRILDWRDIQILVEKPQRKPEGAAA
jgi:hypothetical protein